MSQSDEYGFLPAGGFALDTSEEPEKLAVIVTITGDACVVIHNVETVQYWLETIFEDDLALFINSILPPEITSQGAFYWDE